MFGRTQRETVEKLDRTINRLLDEMDIYGPDTPEYKVMLKQLKQLSALRKSHDKRLPSPDTIVTVAGTVVSVLIMVSYERVHVMTSKAINFVPKAK